MIWVIGGTGPAVTAAVVLKNKGYDVLVTTASEYGKAAVPPDIKSLAGQLAPCAMAELVDHYAITVIVDASHPYAAEVSKNAMAVSKQKQLPYVRFERRELSFPVKALIFNTYPEIAAYLATTTGNILITTGSRNLHFFAELDKHRVFVRLLPVTDSILKAESLGFLTKNLIALQGPASIRLNRALIKEYSIRILVIKQSGVAGGEHEKIRAAIREKVKIVILARPELSYPVKVYGEKELLRFIYDIV